MPESVIGWDLGGAHVKAARAEDGRVTAAMQVYSPLWQGLAHLERAVETCSRALGPADRHAVTMTGEMVDLFETREAGVAALVETAARMLGSDAAIFAGKSGFVAPGDARTHMREVASANWLASAMWAAAKFPEALFVDIGSTTTDIVPVLGGKVRSAGSQDFERLALGELVYSGVLRTPVMAVVPEAEFDGERQGVIAENFATMADAYRVAGRLPEGIDDTPTADGGAKNEQVSARRLARMLGRESDDREFAAWKRFAEELIAAQSERIEKACRRVADRAELSEDAAVIGAGCGSFLARDIAGCLARPYEDFADCLDAAAEARQAAGVCAPAAAVALLLSAR